MKKQYTITRADAGKRLCDYLQEQGYSRTMLIRLKNDGGLTVNGEFHRNIDPVSQGDFVEIEFPDKDAVLTPNGNLHIPVLFENEDILIYDKPDDILVHPATKEFDDALGNDFAFRHPGIPFRPLGRLDRHTTGACIIAKNKLTAVQLSSGIEKEYLAVAEGLFEEKEGTVDAPLIRVAGSTIMRRVDPAGQRSVTHYKVLGQSQSHTLLSLRLETGRTHQIRVHMAYTGHPLAGDTLYGGSTGLIQRQALHCAEIRFSLNGREYAVSSPLPGDMSSLVSFLKK